MKTRTCKICGGIVEPLGKLGLRTHGRCRNCGMMFSWILRSDKRRYDDPAFGHLPEIAAP